VPPVDKALCTSTNIFPLSQDQFLTCAFYSLHHDIIEILLKVALNTITPLALLTSYDNNTNLNPFTTTIWLCKTISRLKMGMLMLMMFTKQNKNNKKCSYLKFGM
jgi:hypothetical protein